MPYEMVLANIATLALPGTRADIAIESGRIAAIRPHEPLSLDGRAIDLTGCIALPGLVETHIHLDKSCIIDRCTLSEGTLAEAIQQTSAAKKAFTEEDILVRARNTLEKAIAAGTQYMRTHVEIDPVIGLKGFSAVMSLKAEYGWALDMQVCVFPQEGLTNLPGTEELLIKACEQGADLIGGCPYTDTDPSEHIRRIFAIARRFDLDVDFHLDFDLDPSWSHLDEVLRQTEACGYGGRVAVGHVTKLSALHRERFADRARALAEAGIAVTVLPATDLFLMGRDHDHNVPRGVTRADTLSAHGVTCSIATNNVLNPFTPFGDCSLIRMANLFANIAQLGRPNDLDRCLDMVTTSAARLMRLPEYGIHVGGKADIIAVAAPSPWQSIAEIARPVMGLKSGRHTFTAPLPTLHRP